MPGLSIGDLPLPPARFDLAGPPEWMSYGFETVTKCEHEDRVERSPRLARVDLGDPELNRWARRLARELADEDYCPVTRASRQFCRDQRRATVGGIWQFVDRYRFSRMATGTLAPEAWRSRPGELLLWNPVAALNALRSLLTYYGAGKADGALIGLIHGDFLAPVRLFEPHLHFLATEGMLDVLERLRGSRLCQHAPGPRHPADPANPALKLRPGPFAYVPDPFSYLDKSFWSVRKSGVRHLIGSGRMSRIAEPYASEVLLFLDRWQLNQVSLLMGVRVGREGIVMA